MRDFYSLKENSQRAAETVKNGETGGRHCEGRLLGKALAKIHANEEGPSIRSPGPGQCTVGFRACTGAGASARAGTVGSMSSASQLAALGPATTFIDGSLYLFAFLNVATTNLYASALASRNRASDGGGEGGGSSSVVRKNGMGNDELPGEGVVRTAAKTSLYSGIGLMLLLLAVARPLIALYIGEWCSKRLFRRREVVPIRSWMLWDDAMMLCGNDFVLLI